MDSGALYALAIECAKKHDIGCELDCANCQFNVFNYGLPISEASLLKANAYTAYYDKKDEIIEADIVENVASIIRWVAVIVVSLVFLWTCTSFRSCTQPEDTIPDHDMPEAIYLRDNRNKVSNIPLIFEVMRKYGVPDVNRDSKVDCIDYSLWFRMLYGSKARITVNVNPSSGMNHMFIRIVSGYDVIDLEPQGDEFRYSMGSVWGSRYDPRYNRDETSKWSHVVR